MLTRGGFSNFEIIVDGQSDGKINNELIGRCSIFLQTHESSLTHGQCRLTTKGKDHLDSVSIVLLVLFTSVPSSGTIARPRDMNTLCKASLFQIKSLHKILSSIFSGRPYQWGN